MLFVIVTDLRSRKNAYAAYRQLKKAYIPNKKIKISFKEVKPKEGEIILNCIAYKECIVAEYGKETELLHANEIFDYFFIRTGYKEKIVLRSEIEI